MLARPLRRGDTIGIVAPSDPVPPGHAQLLAGIRCLESLGFRVVLGQAVCASSLGYAASPQAKAGDLNAMFADESVHAIICAQGGATANSCLAYLDWNLIMRHPKIVLGISDITVLLNAFYAHTGLVTFHGNDVMWGLGRTPTAYDLREFTDRLVEAKIGPVAASRPRQTIRGGEASGPLIGGHLGCLLNLAGTPYWPDLTGTVLFLEHFQPAPARCDHELHHLAQMGVFDKIAGVLVGWVDGMENQPVQLHDILLRITADYRFPILKVRDFGHNCPNTTLPIGARVHLDADRQSYEIVEPCLAP
ncbi:MAG: LD-carboxypeptidase [Opitutae bacterium]|nr:LD-carboxypeptidase [Opitutae bacterium]